MGASLIIVALVGLALGALIGWTRKVVDKIADGSCCDSARGI